MNRVTRGMNVSKPGLVFRFRYLLLLTTIFAGGSIILTSNKGVDFTFIDNESSSSWESSDIDRHAYDIIHSEEAETIKTEGCSIPALKPLDENIKDFVKYPYNINSCPNSRNALLGNDRKKIWVKYENINHYNITLTDKLTCCYRSFYRPILIEDIRSKKVDARVKYAFCIKFNDTIEVRDEFVRVTCTVETQEVYDQYFLFAPKKPFVKHENKGEIPRNKPGYNVLIMGIDAVSRMNFHRTMPKTLSYLNKKGAIELLGYNKIGDNTFPNLMPMLLGLKDSELKKTCYPHSAAYFDNCPFIWEWFKQAGYYTALGEDSSFLGTFNYAKRGFSDTPTDYYIHTFMHEAEKHVGRHKDFNAYLCMNEKYFYKVLLDYIEDLTWTLKYKRIFGFFWEVSMSHDHLNYPMIMDNDYVKTFSNLEATGYLNNTILFLVSDHGIRWGSIRRTRQGRLEERLPFIYILTPPSFKNNFKEAYNNLKMNRKRLTTPFDIHATLLDLLDLKNIQDLEIIARSNKNYAYNRGISMFLPIPGNRTCKTAEIEDHWCTCVKDFKTPKDDPKAAEAALSLVELINNMLEDYPQCAKLALVKLIDVTKVEAKTESNGVSWTEFVLLVNTRPGGGIFEATLRQANLEKWQLAGMPSRLNLYGNQSRCVQNYKMKLYCYCN